MATITAKDVAELRAQTGLGMMDCKKALVEAEGDMEKAVKILREKGMATAEKKAGRIAAEGRVDILTENGVTAMVEVNSETDFAAKTDAFMDLVKNLATVVATENPADVDALKACKYPNSNLTVTEIMQEKVAIVLLGTGDPMYESFFRGMEASYKGRVCSYIAYDNALSHQIYAASDLVLMPSKFEPCGISQMISLRYGTLPIVRETGGLRDSIHDCTLGEGNGFTFAGYSAHELYDACCRAQDRYYNKEDWNNLVKYDMECDFSWDLSAKSYEGLYNETANLW